MTVGFCVTHVRIAAPHIFHRLFVWLASYFVAESSFKAASIYVLIFGEIPACGVISFGFRITRANPPLGACGIQTLSPGLFQRRVHCGGLARVFTESYEHRPSTPECIFIDVELVFRQTICQCLFQRTPCYGPSHSTSYQPQETQSREAYSRDSTDAWHQ